MKNAGVNTIVLEGEDGEALREKVREHFRINNLTHRDYGTEADYRYIDSPVILTDKEDPEPPFHSDRITPSTWPGVRAPHIMLKDGLTSTHDLLGPGPCFALFDFAEDETYGAQFSEAASALNVPLRVAGLSNEERVKEVYGRSAVLIRPDGHVAWRSPKHDHNHINALKILRTAVGLQHESSHLDTVD